MLAAGFAFVGVDDRGEKSKGRTVYVLESAPVQLPGAGRLLFDLYRRSNAISLQVCLDSLANCPYEAPALRDAAGGFWREAESVSLPAGTGKVFFVATQWKRFKWLALDQVRLEADCAV